jgi:RNA polymerase sigma factor (sigma-70 family)
MASPTPSEVEALYRRFGPALVRRCRRLLANEAEANDCVHDAFAAYLKGDWRGEAQPFTVLYRIATCQAIDRVRRSARWHGVAAKASVGEDEDTMLETQAQLWSTAQRSISDAQRLDWAHDISLLTAGEDETTLAAATMHWVEGHTLEEVAQTLGVTRKTVAARLTRLMERAQAKAAEEMR